MIADITQSLVDKIAAVPTLAGRVGLTLGGTEADPTLTITAPPIAWVVFEGASDASQGDGKTAAVGKYQRLLMTYRVVLVLPYGNGQEDLKDQLQLIEDVATAVRGSLPHEYAATGWLFQGTSLLGVETDRISYSLTFQTTAQFQQ